MSLRTKQSGFRRHAPTGLVHLPGRNRNPVVRSSTALANAIPRVFMDDTPADREATQLVINQIVFDPLSELDGRMKTKDWSEAPAIPGPESEDGGEIKWVVPEKFFAQLPEVLDTVPPLPGEESLYAQFHALLAVAARDPAAKQALTEAAVATDKESNWLPAPEGPFSLYIRAYWGKEGIVNGSWQPPLIKAVQ